MTKVILATCMIVIFFTIPANAIDIQTAVVSGDKTKVEQLLNKGVDPNTKDDSGSTPLHYAAFFGDKDMSEILVIRGANVNAQNSDGSTPLHIATAMSNRDVVELLITKGSDVNAQNHDGMTPLSFASSADIAKLLIENGAKVNGILQSNNKTPKIYIPSKIFPLMSAAYSGNTEVAKVLIANGANVNEINVFGNTSLHMAAKAGHQDMIDLLIAHGAKLNIRDNKGQTPAMLADNKKFGIKMGLWFNQLIKWQF